MSISISPTLKIDMHPSGPHELDYLWTIYGPLSKNWTIFTHKHYVVQLVGLHFDVFPSVGLRWKGLLTDMGLLTIDFFFFFPFFKFWSKKEQSFNKHKIGHGATRLNMWKKLRWSKMGCASGSYRAGVYILSAHRRIFSNVPLHKTWQNIDNGPIHTIRSSAVNPIVWPT